MAKVLSDVARARNISKLARQTGIARETPYKVTHGEGNPTLDTEGRLANALGFRLSPEPLVVTPAAAKPRIRKTGGARTTRNAGKAKPPPLKHPITHKSSSLVTS